MERRCVFDSDVVNRLIEKAEGADGFVFGTPVYYAHPSGRILSFLDRAFYAGGAAFAHKPGASIAVARRAGTCASVDVLNKYFTINQMPVVSSTSFGAGKRSAGSNHHADDACGYKRQCEIVLFQTPFFGYREKHSRQYATGAGSGGGANPAHGSICLVGCQGIRRGLCS